MHSIKSSVFKNLKKTTKYCDHLYIRIKKLLFCQLHIFVSLQDGMKRSKQLTETTQNKTKTTTTTTTKPNKQTNKPHRQPVAIIALSCFIFTSDWFWFVTL